MKVLKGEQSDRLYARLNHIISLHAIKMWCEIESHLVRSIQRSFQS